MSKSDKPIRTRARISVKQKEAFIQGLAATGRVTEAAKVAGIHVSVAYAIRRREAKFRRAWQDTLDNMRIQKIESGEASLYHRAVEGVLEPVYYKGRVVGHRRVYSDPLLLRFLQAEKPGKYSPAHQLEHSGTLDTKATIVILPQLEDEE